MLGTCFAWESKPQLWATYLKVTPEHEVCYCHSDARTNASTMKPYANNALATCISTQYESGLKLHISGLTSAHPHTQVSGQQLCHPPAGKGLVSPAVGARLEADGIREIRPSLALSRWLGPVAESLMPGGWVIEGRLWLTGEACFKSIATPAGSQLLLTGRECSVCTVE